MSEWRPESWENDFEYKRALEGEYLLPSVVFEAGADAIVAALREQGGRVKIEDTYVSINVSFYQGSRGHLVFIPDKE